MIKMVNELVYESQIEELERELKKVKAKSEQRRQIIEIHLKHKAIGMMSDGSIYYEEGKAIMDALSEDVE